MIYKEIKDDQLFVYHNGNLIYKKWLRTSQSVVFEKFGLPTWSQERGLIAENNKLPLKKA
tara:strand:+ start:7096 stop:7275 length:180 start_codon:yes stop_codon:yes gene_type:complete